jgi:hypothetical protein
MSRFTTEHKFHPIHIDFELLHSLEELLTESLPKEILNKFPNGIKKDYSVKLTDKYGIEELKSIEEYKLKYLPDTIEQLAFEIVNKENNFSLKILFDKEEGSSLYLNLEFDEARGIAVQLIDKLDRLLINHKSINFLFHPYFLISITLFIIWFYNLLMFLSNFSDKNYKDTISYFLIIVSLTSYYLIGSYIKTIASFETKKYFILNKHISWFVAGNISFFIFGILYPFIIEIIKGK